jgi:putative oxidoreductase
MGQVLLGSLSKSVSFGDTMARMDSFGLSPAWALLPATIALEPVGGLLVCLGGRNGSLAALALAAFTIATNVYFHDYWAMQGELAALH